MTRRKQPRPATPVSRGAFVRLRREIANTSLVDKVMLLQMLAVYAAAADGITTSVWPPPRFPYASLAEVEARYWTCYMQVPVNLRRLAALSYPNLLTQLLLESLPPEKEKEHESPR